MNTPVGLLGGALLFWGWQTGFLWLGVIAAVVLEGARFVRSRWNFAQTDLDRIWDLCVILFLGMIVIAFFATDGVKVFSEVMTSSSPARRSETLNQGTRSVILVLQWLPFVLMPIALAQAFSGRERMDWSTFSLWLRRQRKVRGEVSSRSGVNAGWPYFIACLLGASAANERSLRFTICLALLVGWALWARRPRTFPAWAWAGSLAIAVGLGVLAQEGLRNLQLLAQRLDGVLIARFSGGRGYDAKEERTMLDSVGRLKLSGKIVLRVEAQGEPPALLREASYNLFKSPYWAAPQQDFKELNSETNLTTWKLLPRKATTRWATISAFLPGGRGLLPVPHGTAQLEDLPIITLQTNLMGLLQSTEGPGFVRFRTAYGEGESIDSLPDSNDLIVASLERMAVTNIANELQLESKTPEQALKVVSEFLTEKFRYSTWLGDRRRRRSNETALTRFLLQTREGHCEYFASATVMLLRQAGIPARYAVGYSVQEKKEDQWIVRERHAHAWCLAWVNDAWRDVDNTPPDWSAVEGARASGWEKISDAWSNVWFKFSEWRWGKGEWKRYILWLLAPLLALTTWRLLSRKQWSRVDSRSKSRGGQNVPGLDSEFFQVERRMAQLGYERRKNETWSAWSTRLRRHAVPGVEKLDPLVGLHQRLRFDPEGLANDDRVRLRAAVADVLKSVEGVPERGASLRELE